MSKHLSPLYLKALVTKIDGPMAGLSCQGKMFLHCLLAWENNANLERDGYYSWPGIETLMKNTSLSEATIKRLRKVLKDDGWIAITPGKGPGSSNKYLINAQKIVDAYVASGFQRPDKPLAKPKLSGNQPVKTSPMNIEEDEDDDYPY